MNGPISLSTAIQGQGTPLLCLHGHPGSAKTLSVFTENLSQRFRTIAPDLRGYGESQVNQQFTMTDHLNDLEFLLEQQNIKRAWVLGWSLGGILAMELALRCSDRIQGLVLVATAARPVSNHPQVTGLDLLATGIAAILNGFRPGWRWNIETFGKRSLYRYLIQQHHPTAYRYLASSGTWAYLRTSKYANRALANALRQGYNSTSNLQQIRCPCLMLIGASDRHIMPQSSLETAKALPNCEYRLYADTAHLLPWEIPEQILQDINGWLDRHLEEGTLSPE